MLLTTPIKIIPKVTHGQRSSNNLLRIFGISEESWELFLENLHWWFPLLLILYRVNAVATFYNMHIYLVSLVGNFLPRF